MPDQVGHDIVGGVPAREKKHHRQHAPNRHACESEHPEKLIPLFKDEGRHRPAK